MAAQVSDAPLPADLETLPCEMDDLWVVRLAAAGGCPHAGWLWLQRGLPRLQPQGGVLGFNRLSSMNDE
jgi:hypothetical protein